MKKAVLADKRNQRCALWAAQDVFGVCEGRIELHHAWQYAGRQLDEVWAIVGACHKHHDMVPGDPAVKAAFETASLLIATDEDLAKYPRRDWQQVRKSLGLTARRK